MKGAEEQSTTSLQHETINLSGDKKYTLHTVKTGFQSYVHVPSAFIFPWTHLI